MMPSPMSVDTEGMPHAAERALTSSSAPDATTPPPTYSRGRAAAAIIRAMRASTAPSASGGSSRAPGAGSCSTSMAACWTSLGRSIRTGPWPTGEGHPKRFRHDFQELRGGPHQEVVLGDRNAHAVRIHFLERVGADQRGGNLASHRHDRDRIQLGIRDGREKVDGAGAGRGEARGRLSRGPCHALRQEAAGLLVTHQHVTQAALAKGVVERQVGAARDARDDLYPLSLQELDQE